MDLREVSDLIYAGGDRQKMQEMNEVYYEMSDWIRDHDHSMYVRFRERAEDICYSISMAEAKDIVKAMRPAGEKWSFEDIGAYIRERGESDVKAYYMVMNMAYNDYRFVAEEFNTDSPDFYYSLAHSFIDDQDGGRHKVQKYFTLL